MPEPFEPPSMLQVQGSVHPGSIPATRLDRSLDELHSQDTVFDGGEREGRPVERGIVPAREDEAPLDRSALSFPTVEDGVLGVKFVEATVESSRRDGAWVDASLDLEH